MHPISPELIEKYLAGKCNADEEATVLNWFNAPENEPDAYEQLSPEAKQALEDRLMSGIREKIRLFEPPIKKFNYYRAGAIAASILIFITVGLLWFKQPAANQSKVGSDNIRIVNTGQNIKKVALPDGSTAWLSPGTIVTYDHAFNRQFRTVSLTGESFFDVKKDHAHPFIVRTAHMSTKVWGTSFSVKDNEHALRAEVAVVTGKVSVAIADRDKNNMDVMLHPQQKAVWQVTAKKTDTLKVSLVEKHSALKIWEKASLSFNGVALRDAVRVLQQQFDVIIMLPEGDHDLAEAKLQADFSNQSLPEIMEVLEKLLNVSYVTDGKKFVLQRALTTN
ncbi:FecR family protein [Mucilaginibacter sp. Mucisp86]|uniref:FecR family protein n=1 Tax=Mucilaginibacter sp. Mucisp86 TaxID=3243060 RepID=UPI0039B6909B